MKKLYQIENNIIENFIVIADSQEEALDLVKDHVAYMWGEDMVDDTLSDYKFVVESDNISIKSLKFDFNLEEKIPEQQYAIFAYRIEIYQFKSKFIGTIYGENPELDEEEENGITMTIPMLKALNTDMESVYY